MLPGGSGGVQASCSRTSAAQQASDARARGNCAPAATARQLRGGKRRLERSNCMDPHEGEWTRKGATLSDKTAREEFGLTMEEIVQAIRDDKLQYREHNIYGNPWLRLLRREVEALVKSRSGSAFLVERQAKAELKQVDKQIRLLKTQLKELEGRRVKLVEGLSK
jgi:hypothetical protein